MYNHEEMTRLFNEYIAADMDLAECVMAKRVYVPPKPLALLGAQQIAEYIETVNVATVANDKRDGAEFRSRLRKKEAVQQIVSYLGRFNLHDIWIRVQAITGVDDCVIRARYSEAEYAEDSEPLLDIRDYLGEESQLFTDSEATEVSQFIQRQTS